MRKNCKFSEFDSEERFLQSLVIQSEAKDLPIITWRSFVAKSAPLDDNNSSVQNKIKNFGVTKNSGFILFSVLIILQILLLLGWYSVQNSLLLLKSSHKIYQQQVLFSAVKLNLHKLEKSLQTNIPLSCVVPLTSFGVVEKILTKPLAAKGCQIKIGEINFKYLIEILGQNPCHIIKNNATIAQYLRLNLFATSRQTKDAVIFLQSIIARPIVSTEICHAKLLKILPGRQSWRQV